MPTEPISLDPRDVRRINHLCTGFAVGLRDEGMLEAACARPVASAGGEWVHPGTSAQVLALLDGIIRFHPFIDGNKRTAVVAADLYLYDLGFVWRLDDTSKFGLVVAMASGCGGIDELPGNVEEMEARFEIFHRKDLHPSDREIVLRAMVLKNYEVVRRLDEYDRLGGDRS